MADRGSEEFTLDLADGDTFREEVAAGIAERRAQTANVVAVLLVSGIVLSLPVTLLAAFFWPENAPSLEGIFDRWVTAVGPLGGLAVGFYFGSRSARWRGEGDRE